MVISGMIAFLYAKSPVLGFDRAVFEAVLCRPIKLYINNQTI
jgi:hypothetical protein